MQDKYKELLKISKNLALFSSINGKLVWDMHTQIPKKGMPLRSQQFAFIEEQITDIFNSKETSDVVNSLISHNNGFDEYQQRNIIVFQRVFNRRTSIPKDLQIQNKRQEGISFSKWQEAKRSNNFKIFQPELEKNLENKRQIAKYIDPESKPFDVFLAQYEPGFSAKKIKHLFDSISRSLIPILNKLQNTNSWQNKPSINKKMDVETQKKLVHDVAKYIGYDMEAGRIDHGEHPMTYSFSLGDVRFTVNYNGLDYTQAFFAGMHEAGHAIHGQNVPNETFYDPIRMFGNSAGINESQSRFYENIIGRSKSFWNGYRKNFQNITGIKLENVEEYYNAINNVQLSKIRIQADELTYVLHIILRFEIENALLEGDINVSELPSMWNEKIQEVFGLEVQNDAEGVLQDIHWATTFYGYFPTYALGNMYNAQMYNTIKKEIDFNALLEKGEVLKITKWLRENIHIKTGLYDPEEFLIKVTSEKLNPDYFVEYLNNKYSNIYT